MRRLDALQERLGHKFRAPALLVEAVTHPSHVPDHPDAGPHNQRLEFLGDAVLHLVLTATLYQLHSGEREGALSKRRSALTKGGFLSVLARELGLDACLRLGKSEEDTGGRTRASNLEDALEAVVGAIYLDSDFATVSRVVLAWYGPLDARIEERTDQENPKGSLQELVQPVHGNSALRYEVKSTTGPRHAREYHVAVFLKERELGAGSGTSKKTAEENAARAALLVLRAEGGAKR